MSGRLLANSRKAITLGDLGLAGLGSLQRLALHLLGVHDRANEVQGRGRTAAEKGGGGSVDDGVDLELGNLSQESACATYMACSCTHIALVVGDLVVRALDGGKNG